MTQQITVPEIGENVTSGTVVGILVSEGDQVEKDDAIIEFETEKAVVEIPSPAKGKIVDIRVKEGDELRIGDVIAIMETEQDDSDSDTGSRESGGQDAAASADKKTGDEQDEPRAEPRPEPEFKERTRKADTIDDDPKADRSDRSDPTDKDRDPKPPPSAAPSVRRLARELGLDIQAVSGSGPGGRISEDDVKKFVKASLSGATGEMPAASVSPAEPDLPDFTRWGKVKTQAVSTVRRITAENMTRSWRLCPQVTQFDKAPISQLQDWIELVNRRQGSSGVKLTITAVLVKVLGLALQRFPHFNASLDLPNQQVIVKQYVHMGMAVDTDRGLLVPVLRDVNAKRISDLAGEISDLADRARRKKLNPDEMEGGTFTISNQGGVGGGHFTPIVFWPQAAILGVGRAVEEARRVNGEWIPETMLPLALSYDHRINDGADAARFLKWVCDALHHPLNLQL